VSRPRFARRVRGRRALTLAFALRLILQLSGGCEILARQTGTQIGSLFESRPAHSGSIPQSHRAHKPPVQPLVGVTCHPLHPMPKAAQIFTPVESPRVVSTISGCICRAGIFCPQPTNHHGGCPTQYIPPQSPHYGCPYSSQHTVLRKSQSHRHHRHGYVSYGHQAPEYP
jgi:hypothetical protein